MSETQFEAFRIFPGEDLKQFFTEYASKHKILSGFVVICVGSMTRAKLRMAGAKDIRDIEGPLEITSLVGTFGTDGSHFYVSVSDKMGPSSEAT